MQLSCHSQSEQKPACPPESSSTPFPLLGAVAWLKTWAHFIHVKPRDGVGFQSHMMKLESQKLF